MNRHVVLLIVAGAVLGLLGFILWDVYRPTPEDPTVDPEIPEATSEPVAAVLTPIARRELSIAGRVVGPSLEARAGLRVVCGEDSAETDAGGTFSFPKRDRPRLVTVRLLSREQEIAVWNRVVAGDPASDGDEPSRDPTADGLQPAPYDIGAAAIPPRPERVRWTINLASTSTLTSASASTSAGAGDALPGAAAPAPPNGAWIEVGESMVEEWGNGARVRVRGTTRLPDGAHVAASLYFDGLRTIATLEAAIVNSGTFEAALYSPGDARLYSGVFEIRASFNSVLESYSAMEEWKKSRPEVDWDALTVPEASRNLLAGDPLEAREEDQSVRAYYAQAGDAARRLERSLKSVLLSRLDEKRVFAEGKGLSSRSAQAGPRAWLRADFLDGEGKLDEARWRKFLDEDWRPSVRALAEAHTARGQEKYMTASTLLANLLESLLDESCGFSKFVIYPAFKLEPHPNDFYVDEERAGDLVRLERVVVGAFEGLERFRHLAE